MPQPAINVYRVSNLRLIVQSSTILTWNGGYARAHIPLMVLQFLRLKSSSRFTREVIRRRRDAFRENSSKWRKKSYHY